MRVCEYVEEEELEDLEGKLLAVLEGKGYKG
jgi:hypothetical protein